MVSTITNNDRKGSKRKRSGYFDEIAPNVSNSSLVQTDVAQIRNQINIYRQLFIENKINRDNAWDIQIIDDVNYLVTNGLIDSEMMLIAAMALDICIKVYACKVEYIENEITKLMCNIQAQTEERIAAAPKKAKNDEHKSKANKRKRCVKMYVAKDQKSILLPAVPKVVPIHFTENLDLYASDLENMSTIITPVNHSMYKFELLNNIDCGFISYSDPDPTIQTKLFPMMNVLSKPIVICREFHTFNVDEEDEDYNRSAILPMNDHFEAHGVSYNGSQDTVPDFEERTRSSFPDVANMSDTADDAEENDETAKSQCSRGKKIEIITSLSPTAAFVENLTSPNPLLDIIWMGPSHWKNKFVQLSGSKISGKNEQRIIHPNKKRRRLTEKVEPINFRDSNIPKINFRQKCKPKPLKFDIKKYTIAPKVFHDLNLDKMINGFLLRQDCGEKDQLDSLCSHADGLIDSSEEYTNNDNLEENQRFEAPNVAPEENYLEYRKSFTSVSTGYINMMDETNAPYPRRAKRVNMRKLKNMILSCLIEDDNANTIHDSIKETSVKPTKFSDLHRKLLQKLPLQMKNDISIPVVFFALLQLANQHDLSISGCPSLNDAIIEKH